MLLSRKIGRMVATGDTLGGSTEGALQFRRPARHQVGPSSVAVLPVAERVWPIVTAPTASPAPVAVGCRRLAQLVGYQTGQ